MQVIRNRKVENMRTEAKWRGGAGALVTLVVAVALVAIAALAASGGASGQSRSAPVNQIRPKIDGTTREGNTLSADLGAWGGTKPISFSGVWRRCGSNGGNCSDIGGTQNTLQYKLTQDDVGSTIRIVVTAKNADGMATATSSPTAVIKAAPAQSPRNTTAPSIAGNAQEGQTLTGNRGNWDGSEPISYTLNWQRCDQNGGSCANISGASAATYTLTSADVNNRVRLRVIAGNAAGKTTAYSQPTAVVTAKGPSLPPGAIKLPDGKISIPVASVSIPERLNIAQLDFSPNPLRSRNDTITARFRIYDTRGYVVRDALVFVIPLPYGWTTQPAETTTGTDGWAQVQMRATSQMPRKAAVVMFVRARKPGDNVLTGVTARRLVQMLVSIQ
jgi:hypothetical protein